MNDSQTKEVEIERVHFFDAMRAILIIFIVIIHILQIFNPSASWLIYNTNDMIIAPIIIHILMLFTLQSFFIMSGYLAAMSIKKIGLKKFFDSRVKRIFIPIIFAALTLNSLQAYLLTQFGWIDLTLYSYLIEGKWVSHLWFLINLVIFFLLTYWSVKFFNSTLKNLNDICNSIFEKAGLHIILLLTAFVILCLIILFSILSPFIYNQIINISSILFYFPFFILGAFLFNNQKVFKKFIQMPIIQTLIITTLFTVLAIYFSESSTNIEKIAYNFFDAASKIFASALCFTIFYNLLNKEFKIFSFLANASYTIYLFHHVIVVALGLLLIKFNIGGYLGFFILFSVVIIITLGIHHALISKGGFDS